MSEDWSAGCEWRLCPPERYDRDAPCCREDASVRVERQEDTWLYLCADHAALYRQYHGLRWAFTAWPPVIA